jgi:hypothetical protein
MLGQVPTSKARRRKDMKTRLLFASVLVLAVAFTTPADAAPKATKYQSTITTPTSGSPPVDAIFITKTSKVSVKTTTNNVVFTIKLRGVVDGLDLPVTLAGNTLVVDVLVGGSFCPLSFSFDIAEGKATQKSSIANGSLACSGGVTPGEPIEIQRARVVQQGNGYTFGVAGLTAK